MTYAPALRNNSTATPMMILFIAYPQLQQLCGRPAITLFSLVVAAEPPQPAGSKVFWRVTQREPGSSKPPAYLCLGSCARRAQNRDAKRSRTYTDVSFCVRKHVLPPLRHAQDERRQGMRRSSLCIVFPRVARKNDTR